MNTFESSTDRYNPGVCGLSDEARTNIAVSLPTESLEVIHIPSELVTATQAIDRLMERRERKSERLCWRKEQHAKQWDPEKILKATEDAQAKSLKPRAPGMVFGLSRGFSSWLMREGH